MAKKSYPKVENPDRQITDDVMTAAYVWLTDNIDRYSAVGCKRGINLIGYINAGGTTAADYRDFLELFDNDPYKTAISGSLGRSNNCITSDNLDCYFVSYNGVALPIGFILEYFSEDYPTEREIAAFREEVSDSSEVEKTPFKWLTFDRFHTNLSVIRQVVRHLREVDQFAFGSSAAPIPMLLIRLIPTVILTVLFGVFCSQVKLFSVLYELIFTNGFDFSAAITLSAPINAFGVTLGSTFTVAEYAAAFPHHLLLNALLFIVLIFRLLDLIHGIIFMLQWIKLRAKFNALIRTSTYIDANTLKKYINSVTIADDGQLVTDALPSLQRYIKIASVEQSSDALLLRARTLHRRASYLCTYVDAENGEISTAYTKPKKRLITSAIMIVIFAFLNLPVLYMPIFNFLM